MSRKTKIAPNPRPPMLHCSRLISCPRRARSPRVMASAKASPMIQSAAFTARRARRRRAGAAGPERRAAPCTPRWRRPSRESRAAGRGARARAWAPGWRTARRPACRAPGGRRGGGRRGAGNPGAPGPRSRRRPGSEELQRRGDEDPGAVVERPLVEVEALVVVREDLAARLVARADEEEGARDLLEIGGEV